ncbi:MAG: 23S rRNA (pseudouridine(1915)-N(3))-methyltransferase RlmH [Clostridia bacterium]|nr:23S rRNA (pseudouridine(1915)-N(3))-methyltransferase RlmH [Clostridia bacterium]
MLYIKLICCGKLKESFYKEACAEYEKRLQAFCRLETCRLPEEGGLEKEAVRIMEAIPQGAYTVAMCIEGRTVSSEALADKLRQLQNSGVSKICFIIGSSEGMHQSVKDKADLRLSMSPMTFPHHLARVMLLEQIYRALGLNAGNKYHK